MHLSQIEWHQIVCKSEIICTFAKSKRKMSLYDKWRMGDENDSCACILGEGVLGNPAHLQRPLSGGRV